MRAAGDATVYTTAKNLVASGALLLMAVLVGTSRAGLMRRGGRPSFPLKRKAVAGMLAIAVIGGSVPFVLFFEGLARESSSHAAFLQKTLVIWVALLALPLLSERPEVFQGLIAAASDIADPLDARVVHAY